MTIESDVAKLVIELCKDLSDKEMYKKDIDENNILHYACGSDNSIQMMMEEMF